MNVSHKIEKNIRYACVHSTAPKFNVVFIALVAQRSALHSPSQPNI